MDDKKLQAYLEFAKGLANEAGEIMRRYFRADDIGTEWKEDNTPITVADSKINSMVVEAVKNRYPDHGVLGEEESYEADRDLIWVCDPIDGTSPFSHDIPISCFSLALVERSDGQPLVAVTLDPFQQRHYWAVKGNGAYLNGKKIQTSPSETVKNAFMSVGMGLIGQDQFSTGLAAEHLRNKGASVVNIASHVYFANLVAEGKIQSRFMSYGSSWDSAAVALLVQEAGGIVTDVFGEERRYDEFAEGCVLSSNKTIHQVVLDAIKESSRK